MDEKVFVLRDSDLQVCRSGAQPETHQTAIAGKSNIQIKVGGWRKDSPRGDQQDRKAAQTRKNEKDLQEPARGSGARLARTSLPIMLWSD